MKSLLATKCNKQHSKMSRTSGYNNNVSANAITIAGLNLALSYENAAVDRLERRVSESIVHEVKEKLRLHLAQTREQQERLKERIRALGDEIQPISDKGQLPIPEPPQSLRIMIQSSSSEKEKEVWESLNDLIIERAEAIIYK